MDSTDKNKLIKDIQKYTDKLPISSLDTKEKIDNWLNEDETYDLLNNYFNQDKFDTFDKTELKKRFLEKITIMEQSQENKNK